MNWSRDEDETEKLLQVAKNRRRRGLSTPIIDDKPELQGDLIYFYMAFATISRRRQIGFAACPIQIGEIVAWLDLHGIENPELRQEYFFFITLLDDHWMKWQGQRIEDGNSKTSNSVVKGNNRPKRS